MSEPLRVLYVGETGVDAALIAELERGGFEPFVRKAGTSSELETTLEQKWDIAIAHFSPRQFGAIEALRMIQEKELDLPIIVVSGRVKDADIASILKAGAADHLTRDNLMRLNAAVERELRAVRLRDRKSVV